MRETVFGLFAVALLVGSASPSAAQTKLEELANDPPAFIKAASKLLKWEEPAEPARILGPIYFVGTKGLGVFLITTSAGHIVLNTGMPGSGPMIEASIRKLGFEPQEIELLLTGHAHLDHVGGHAYLKKISGAKIALIREEKELFESGGKLDFHYGQYREFQFEPATFDQVFEDGDQIKLGDVELTALLTPGHTKGSTTFVMDIVVDGQKYHVVFPNGTSVNPGYRLVQDPSYPGIKKDFDRTFETLAKLKPDVWIMPHNEAFNYEAKQARAAKEGVKAWVDPAGYQKWRTMQQEKFQAAVAKEK